MKEEEESFIWERWNGKMCDQREYNLAREMYHAQKKTEKRLLG